MLSTKRLFVVVEGRRFDRHFYDSLLSANKTAVTGGYQVVLCEEATNGSAGKDAALQLFDHLRSRGRLYQRTRRSDHVIAFALDRDYDGVLGRQKRSTHLFYTQACDVEAEIFLRGQLARALSLTLSLTMEDASNLAHNLQDLVKDLAEAWREWITLCCIAIGMRSRCDVHPARQSSINQQVYGNVDSQKHADAQNAVRATAYATTSPTKERWIRRRVDAVYLRGQHECLVKGKNLPGYLHWRIAPQIANSITDSTQFQKLITHSLLSTIDYRADWALPFHAQIDELLDAQK